MQIGQWLICEKSGEHLRFPGVCGMVIGAKSSALLAAWPNQILSANMGSAAHIFNGE
jgi:hypothetical protein